MTYATNKDDARKYVGDDLQRLTAHILRSLSSMQEPAKADEEVQEDICLLIGNFNEHDAAAIDSGALLDRLQAMRATAFREPYSEYSDVFHTTVSLRFSVVRASLQLLAESFSTDPAATGRYSRAENRLESAMRTWLRHDRTS